MTIQISEKKRKWTREMELQSRKGERSSESGGGKTSFLVGGCGGVAERLLLHRNGKSRESGHEARRRGRGGQEDSSMESAGFTMSEAEKEHP